MGDCRRFALALLISTLLFSNACNDPARPGKKQGKPIDATLLCNCKPAHITKDDWRIEFKNGSLPQGEPSEITVAAILAWPDGPEPGPRTARSARELTLYRVRKAYLQSVFLRRSDCDLHLEVSEEPAKNAHRIIVETPGTSDYCPARSNMAADLQRQGITLTSLNQELSQPLTVEIVGVPFRDQAHPVWFARGSDQVTSLWELHPAIVKVLP